MINKEMSKEERIKKELSKLNKIFKNIEKNKKNLCAGLISNAAFMHVTLEDLQTIVNADGAIKLGTNGNGFEVYSEHPAQKSYNVMIDKYVKTMKTLTDLLPDNKTGDAKRAGEDLAKFIAKGKPKGVK